MTSGAVIAVFSASAAAAQSLIGRLWTALPTPDATFTAVTSVPDLLVLAPRAALVFTDGPSPDLGPTAHDTLRADLICVLNQGDIPAADLYAPDVDLVLRLEDLVRPNVVAGLRRRLARGLATLAPTALPADAPQPSSPVPPIPAVLPQQGQDALIARAQSLEEALTKEREAAQIQQQFINMVSHEFRTPLSIIDGNAQLLTRLIDRGDRDGTAKRIKTIRSAVSRLVQMMEGVLSSNLMRSGRITLNRAPMDLRAVLEQLCEEQRELSPGNRIRLECGKDLPETLALDPKLMGLIITNLLSNAVKYGGDQPVVDVSANTHDNELVLSVSDNGVGIPENEKYRIFDRFYRATTAGAVTGTGIGLSLVREMVELHQGRIDVASRVGQGTTFTIYLPL